jgi:hypothetical protein
MKIKRNAIHFACLSLVNCFVVRAVSTVTQQTAYHWSELLSGKILPNTTMLAIQTGFIWPAVFLVLSIIGLILSVKSRLKDETLFSFFGVVVIVELVILTTHMTALIMPSFMITYRMSG